MAQISWQNVLILQTSFLGDATLTLPLIKEVRRRFPAERLSVLCQPASGELLAGHPAIDEIIIEDKKGADRGWRGLQRTALRLKKRKFSLALTPHKSLRSALILYFAGIPHRVGFRESRGWFLFHQRVKRDPALHDVERNLSVLRAFGLSPDQCQRSLELPVSEAIQCRVNQKLHALGVRNSDFVVGLSPGSVWPTKRWSTAGFAALIRLLRLKYDCRVLLFGAPEDSSVVEEILRQGEDGVINLVGNIGLSELAAAISRCRIFVTNDSAPMHIAVARKVPTIALFCATTPDLGFYPYTDDAIVVEKTLPCRPCGSHGGRRCPLGTEDCIRGITPEAVMAAVVRLENRPRNRMVRSSEDFQPECMTL